MKWIKLVDSALTTLQRGHLLKFHAAPPFESEVIMMICGYPDDGNRSAAAALITITGYCAAINPYVVFPAEAFETGPGLSRQWVIENWTKWVWPQGDVTQVLLRNEINADEL